jgi:dihydrofolate synthase/folylpolyglutamate synthase
MEYREALEYLYGLINYEKAPMVYADLKLERMRELVWRLGNPERSLPTILVAGTKGKGSTSYMLYRFLSTSGLRCGLYTKPHLFTFRERIRVEEKYIAPEELAALVEEVKPVVETMALDSPWGKPTYFEVSVALALLYFVQKKVDVAVVEVGLGGRLDATNVTEPQMTVITPISFDHMEVLGDTLESIAREKAGILRRGVPLVLAPQRNEARATILKEAQRRGTPVLEVLDNSRVSILERSERGSRCVFGVEQWGEGEVTLPLLGDHQVTNFLTALLALREWGLDFSLSSLKKTTVSLRWPGRVDVLSRDPLLVFDVAHNRASFQALLGTLWEYLAVKKAVYLLGFLEGKDVAGIAEEVAPVAHCVILTEPLHPKAIPGGRLLPLFASLGIPCELVKDPYQAKEEAWQKAMSLGLPLVVAGSFYLAQPFREEFVLEEVPEEEVELC